ncbi:MAG TPA: hypothetical protein EYM59_03095, partial [Acidimicrobiia bacterium]|nr:hypothetical protein [Acidimicrobiia bacterium]
MVQIDDDTKQALLLFNRRAAAAEAEALAAKRLVKATKAKDDAAEALKVARDSGGGAEVVAEAEAEWRQAVEAWQRLRDGEDPEAEAEPEVESEPEAEPEVESEPEAEPEVES